MSWRKQQTEAKAAEAKPKVEKLSPKEVMSDQIEQLGLGQSLSYRLAKKFGSDNSPKFVNGVLGSVNTLVSR